MAANDAWDLQGMNGAVAVSSGQTFTGLSRGLLVLTTSSFDFDLVDPRGTANAVSLSGAGEGLYVGGPVSSVVVTSGGVAVYPVDLNYTVA